MANLKTLNKNNEVRQVQATVGKFGNTNDGVKAVSSEQYQIGEVAAGAMLVSVTVNVTEAFDGTVPKADISLGDPGVAANLLWDDLDLTAVGYQTLDVTSKNLASIIANDGADLIVVPDLTAATKGKLEVVLTYVDTNITTGTYNSRD